MRTREKILAGVLVVVLVGGVVVPRVWHAFNFPVQQRRLVLQTLEKKLSSLNAEKQLARAKLRRVSLWAARSLPANPQNAMVLYQQWVTDLAEDVVGLQQVDVTPVRLVTTRQAAYVGVRVKLSGRGTMAQVQKLLFLLHQVDLMQRIVNLVLENQQGPNVDLLTVSLTLEGLSLKNAPERLGALFPRSELTQAVNSRSKTFAVKSTNDFQKRPLPVEARVENELVRIEKMEPTRVEVTRGLAGFNPSAHPAGAFLELFPFKSDRKNKTLEDFNVLLTLNPFLKPQPAKPAVSPGNSPPRIEPVADVSVLPGELVSFQLVAHDEETPDQLNFRLGDNAPAGSQLDPQTGRFTWQTSKETPPGDYTFTVTVTDGGTPPQTASTTVTIHVLLDTSQFTYLTATLKKDGVPEAWLYDRSTNKRLILHEGDRLNYAGVQAEVQKIGRDFVQLKTENAVLKLKLGENLRTLLPLNRTP